MRVSERLKLCEIVCDVHDVEVPTIVCNVAQLKAHIYGVSRHSRVVNGTYRFEEFILVDHHAPGGYCGSVLLSSAIIVSALRPRRRAPSRWLVDRYSVKFGVPCIGIAAGGAPGFGGAFFLVRCLLRCSRSGVVVGVVELVVELVVGLVVGALVVVDGGGLPAVICARATLEICGATQTAAPAARPALTVAFASSRRVNPSACSPPFPPRLPTLRSFSCSRVLVPLHHEPQETPRGNGGPQAGFPRLPTGDMLLAPLPLPRASGSEAGGAGVQEDDRSHR